MSTVRNRFTRSATRDCGKINRRRSGIAIAIPLVVGLLCFDGISIVQSDDDLILGIPPMIAATASRSTETPITTPTPDEETSGFFEDFTDNNGLNRFRHGVYHRDDFIVTQLSWPGDHNLACDAPPTTRTIYRENTDDYIYVCKEHMMTSVGDTSGYSIAWFSPDQTFNNISRVCWSVNLTNLGARQWWKVAVLSVTAPDVMSDVGASNLSDLIGPDRVVASWGGIGGAPAKLRIGNSRLDYPNLIAGSDKRTRYPACFRDNADGTLTLEMTGPREGGNVVTERFTTNGSFPSGPLKVVFQDHNYTPTKDDNGVGGIPQGFTWHWDDIAIQ